MLPEVFATIWHQIWCFWVVVVYGGHAWLCLAFHPPPFRFLTTMLPPQLFTMVWKNCLNILSNRPFETNEEPHAKKRFHWEQKWGLEVRLEWGNRTCITRFSLLYVYVPCFAIFSVTEWDTYIHGWMRYASPVHWARWLPQNHTLQPPKSFTQGTMGVIL